MEYKNLFKTSYISSLRDCLNRRCQNVIAERREKQREAFWGSVIPNEEPVSKKTKKTETKKNPRAEMLKKWKAEKMKKLEEAKKKQKPIFKVGVVQRKATGSPVFSQPRTYMKNNLSNLVRNECHTKSQLIDLKKKKVGVVTRATAKKLNITVKQNEPIIPTERKFKNEFCKIDKNKRGKITSHVFNVPEVVSELPSSSLTFPYSPGMMRRKRVEVAEKPKERVSESNEQLKDVPKENFTEETEKVSAPENKNVKEDDFKPIHYSPFVTVRSGKKSVRKSKRKLMFDVDEQIEKEEKEFECRIFSFRKFIECESKRLLETCDKWKHIYEECEEVPGDVEGDIDSIIGKTNLLTSDKFQQFKTLIDKCEHGDPFVKVDDLQGFQDWVALEVERTDEEFHRLERLKENNWQHPRQDQQPKKPTKTSKNGTRKPVGRSNIREHILAARKMLKEGLNGGEIPLSPLKLNTPTKEENLLKKVLSSEIKKREKSAKKSSVTRERRNSGLEIMIATQKNKLPTPAKKLAEASDFEVFFDQENTPNRGILKKSPRKNNPPKTPVTFKDLSQSGERRGRGLSEKYFRPLADSDENSPMRTVLGDLANLSSEGIKTRSRTRLLSQFASPSLQVK